MKQARRRQHQTPEGARDQNFYQVWLRAYKRYPLLISIIMNVMNYQCLRLRMKEGKHDLLFNFGMRRCLDTGRAGETKMYR